MHPHSHRAGRNASQCSAYSRRPNSPLPSDRGGLDCGLVDRVSVDDILEEIERALIAKTLISGSKMPIRPLGGRETLLLLAADDGLVELLGLRRPIRSLSGSSTKVAHSICSLRFPW
jgi:hypothetical protein